MIRNYIYTIKIKTIIKNYDKLIKYAEDKANNCFKEPQIITTGYYSMKVCVDYQKVIQKLKESRDLVEIM